MGPGPQPQMETSILFYPSLKRCPLRKKERRHKEDKKVKMWDKSTRFGKIKILREKMKLKLSINKTLFPRTPPAMPHRLQNLKWPPGGSKMADGVWNGVYH